MAATSINAGSHFSRRAKRPRRLRRRILTCGVFTILILGLIPCSAWLMFPLFKAQVGVDVPREEAPIGRLPEEATNVSYYLRELFGPYTMYEFSVSERGFLEWASANGWELVELKDAYYRMKRYTLLTNAAGEPKYACIANGYAFDWTEEDRGVHVAYDSDTGRAYYFDHSR